MTQSMKILVFAFMLCSSLSAIVCISPVVDAVGESSVRIRVTSDVAFSFSKIQYGPTTAYGTTTGVESATANSAGYGWGTLGGLTPGTTYNAALQLSADNSTFCAAVNVSFTTAAAGTWEPTAPGFNGAATVRSRK